MISTILVSPHRFPTTDTLYLEDKPIAEFINGYCCFWHPLAILKFSAPPKFCSPGELKGTDPESLICFTTVVQDYPGEEWKQLSNPQFMASSNWEESLANLSNALKTNFPNEPQHSDILSLFFGIGFSYLALNALFEAMQHENLISHEAFWNECVQGADFYQKGDLVQAESSLVSALGILQNAREILHSSSIYLIDLAIPTAGKIPEMPGIIGGASNLVLSGSELLNLRDEDLSKLKELIQDDRLEICGGLFQDNLETAKPICSRIWNLQKGMKEYFDTLGKECKVFCKTTPGLLADTPRILHLAGISKAILISVGETQVPQYRGPVFSWSSSVGRQIETFSRQPLDGDSWQTWFHFAYHLARALQQDSSPTLSFLRKKDQFLFPGKAFFALAAKSPLFGKWHTLSSYLQEVYPSEYPGPLAQEDFPNDSLNSKEEKGNCNPVSDSMVQRKERKELDASRTLAGLIFSVKGWSSTIAKENDDSLNKLEIQIETGTTKGITDSSKVLQETARALADRLLSRGDPEQKGYLLINPGGLARRIGLEFPLGQGVGKIQGVLAAHKGEVISTALIEVPGMGFAWVPLENPQEPPVFTNKFILAANNQIRNEFFELEIDPTTGGIRAFRDLKTRSNRLSMQIVSQTGSTMVCKETRILSSGPICGSIETLGEIVGTDQMTIANFRLQVKAWVGRPLLDASLTITPLREFGPNPWHDYLAMRFAWPIDNVSFMRGLDGRHGQVTANRFEGADFLEWRWGTKKTFLFPRSLPFMEKKGDRMLDIIVHVNKEQEKEFHFALSLDREHPFQIAQALETPLLCLNVDKGPPTSGNTGWLFHLDSVNVLLHRISPLIEENGVLLLLEEIGGFATPCDLRCPKDVSRACLVDLEGREQSDLSVRGDTVTIYPESNGLILVKVIFTS